MLFIELDGGTTKMQPQSINWDPPSGLGQDGQGAPVYGPYWTCSLGFSHLTTAEFDRWHDAVDGATHTLTLPHPITGEMTDFTAYVSMVTPRMKRNVQGICTAAVAGADITLTRIAVS